MLASETAVQLVVQKVAQKVVQKVVQLVVQMANFCSLLYLKEVIMLRAVFFYNVFLEITQKNTIHLPCSKAKTNHRVLRILQKTIFWTIFNYKGHFFLLRGTHAILEEGK